MEGHKVEEGALDDAVHAILDAAKAGRFDDMFTQLRKRPDAINAARPKSGWTVLMQAAFACNVKAVVKLLSLDGIDAAQVNAAGESAPQIAFSHMLASGDNKMAAAECALRLAVAALSPMRYRYRREAHHLYKHAFFHSLRAPASSPQVLEPLLSCLEALFAPDFCTKRQLLSLMQRFNVYADDLRELSRRPTLRLEPADALHISVSDASAARAGATSHVKPLAHAEGLRIYSGDNGYGRQGWIVLHMRLSHSKAADVLAPVHDGDVLHMSIATFGAW